MLTIRTGDSETFCKRARKAAEKHPGGIPDYIERVLLVIETMDEQIMAADKELLALA